MQIKRAKQNNKLARPNTNKQNKKSLTLQRESIKLQNFRSASIYESRWQHKPTSWTNPVYP